MGDAGFEHGGDIYDHSTHEVGMDVDIWPIRNDSAQCTAGRIHCGAIRPTTGRPPASSCR